MTGVIKIVGAIGIVMCAVLLFTPLSWGSTDCGSVIFGTGDGGHWEFDVNSIRPPSVGDVLDSLGIENSLSKKPPSSRQIYRRGFCDTIRNRRMTTAVLIGGVGACCFVGGFVAKRDD